MDEIRFGFRKRSSQRSIRGELDDYLKKLSDAGGNSVRIWLFTEGTIIPMFNASGYVVVQMQPIRSYEI